jgi:hypothetical protein
MQVGTGARLAARRSAPQIMDLPWRIVNWAERASTAPRRAISAIARSSFAWHC